MATLEGLSIQIGDGDLSWQRALSSGRPFSNAKPPEWPQNQRNRHEWLKHTLDNSQGVPAVIQPYRFASIVFGLAALILCLVVSFPNFCSPTPRPLSSSFIFHVLPFLYLSFVCSLLIFLFAHDSNPQRTHTHKGHKMTTSTPKAGNLQLSFSLIWIWGNCSCSLNSDEFFLETDVCLDICLLSSSFCGCGRDEDVLVDMGSAERSQGECKKHKGL